jgi:glutathione S-transferase
MIVVHHLENSRSQRVLFMLEELGLEYEIIRYARDPDTQLAPPELARIHPLGHSPVITDGARTVAESGAILEYLAETYGGGRFVPPAGTEDRLRYTYFMHFAEGSAMPWLLLKLVFTTLPRKAPLLLRPLVSAISSGVNQKLVEPQLRSIFGFLEGELAERDYFAGGEFTAADVQMSFPLEAAASRMDMGRYPRLARYVERLHARPAYGRALERGGPYAYA